MVEQQGEILEAGLSVRLGSSQAWSIRYLIISFLITRGHS
jgi:hypothetical protein